MNQISATVHSWLLHAETTRLNDMVIMYSILNNVSYQPEIKISENVDPHTGMMNILQTWYSRIDPVLLPLILPDNPGILAHPGLSKGIRYFS